MANLEAYVANQLQPLADLLVLGDVLFALERAGGFELLAHWTQGEFHHDLVVRTNLLDGAILIVATNCNGGIKEIIAFDEVPDRGALWNWRCPETGFEGELGQVREVARTVHWFDPCELLQPDARSELLPEHRRRQDGGGWVPA